MKFIKFLLSLFKGNKKQEKYVVCIDNEGEEDYLTLGKTYLVYENKVLDENWISVLDDDDLVISYWSDRFKEI